MAHHFCSDVHLRLDRPELGNRFAQFVRSLQSVDTLVIGGDLCDFWMASRETPQRMQACPGLQSLNDFSARGGELIILLGNHDLWLRSFYEDQLSARVVEEPFRITVYGLRILLVHGHRVRTGWQWKQLLESRAFSWLFSVFPATPARVLDRLLERANQSGRAARHRRLTERYRDFIRQQPDSADLFLFGHLHQRIDERLGASRFIVLGDWQEEDNYVMIDECGVSSGGGGPRSE